MAIGKFNRSRWNEKQKKRQERQDRVGGASANFAKPGAGVSYWKLLPPWSEKVSDPCHDVLLYYGYTKGDGKMTVYKGFEDESKCPLLKRFKRLKEAGKKKLASKYKPKRLYLYNAINVKTGELCVLQVSQQVQDGIDEDFEERPESFNPFDLDNSYVLKIKRKGTTWHDTKYTARFAKVKFEMPDDVDFDSLPDLTKVHMNWSIEDLTTVTKGGVPERSDAEEKPKKKEREVVEEEEEEEEEVEEQEETEELDAEDDFEEEEEEDEESDDEEEEEDFDEDLEQMRKELEEEL